MRPRDRQRRRPTRRHAFRPGAEGLEPRIVLSGTGNQIGVSLDFNSWGGNNPIWTDLHNLTTGWSPSSGSTLSLTPDGYPLADAHTAFSDVNYPSGTYQFSYTGGGTVSFSGSAQLAGPVTVANGVTSGSLRVDTVSGAYIQMQVTNVSASDPMDNFHLMMPGYGNGTTPEPMFTPDFIDALKPFSDIRFLNWTETNGSTLANWSDRISPNAFNTTASGVPFEDMIELCNEAQKDMWINVPVLATPQFVQSLAQLISSKLDSNLNVYVEYGNENWSSSTQGYGEIATAAAANPVLNHALSQYQQVAQQSAYTLVNDGQIFDQVFGSGASRVRPVLGAQATWDQFETYELQFIQKQFGAPSSYIYAVDVGPYIQATNQNASGLTLAQLFANMQQWLTGTIIPDIDLDASLAKQYNVGLVAYEGGQALVPGANNPNYNLLLQAQTDPRMGQLYAELEKAWQQAGGGVFDEYQFTGVDSQYGFWGLIPNVTVAGSPKYDGVLSAVYPTADANTDGMVDFADYQIIAADYGDYDASWTQGDTNQDGVVNWADLNTLRQDLNPAGFTLAQLAQQALFQPEATVDAPTALEYDGYGITYAGSLGLTSTSGTVTVNQTASGQSISLGGVPYAQGLGFAGGSSTTIALNGQYARFDSTIGVDSSGSSSSSVIFQVYGDNQLLYQSGVLASGSAAVPIDVNVAGVENLKLVVEAAPGSTASLDHGVWADARLVSTANFGSTQPYTMTWQVSQNGQVISTQTADSFVLPAVSGAYNLSLTVTNANGQQATASTTVTVVPNAPSASLILRDSARAGSWIRNYGAQGYDIAGVGTALPPYADVSVAGALTYVWASSTTDARALRNPDANLNGLNPTAATWTGSSFTIDVNLSDGQVHDLAIYAVDWGKQGRVEQVQVINAATGAVLDTETLSSFGNGAYLEWAVSGSIQIKVTNLSGPNAVVSGLFFSAPPATPSALTQMNGTTQGNWIGTFGTQGYDIPGVGSNLPSYATAKVTGASLYSWTTSTTDVRGLQNPGGTGRTAIAWYSTTSFTINVDLTDGKVHDLALYALDWDSQGRVAEFQLTDAATGRVIDTETIGSFSGGKYLQWAVSGDVLITVTNIAGTNTVISGLFLDPAATASTTPTPTPTSTASATFLNENTATQGNWIGVLGSQGYDIEGTSPSLPSSDTVGVSGATTYTYATGTTDVRALQAPGGSGRTATTWFAKSSFTIDVNLADGASHLLSLYALDWGRTGRVEQVQLIDAATGAVLDTETLSSFGNGAYLQWVVSGHVQIKVTDISGANAVVSGVFLDPTSTPTVSFVKADATTEGNWIGTYGGQGYDIEGTTPSLPSSDTVGVSGATTYTYATGTTDVRALQAPGGSGRTATTWLAKSSFTIDVNLADGASHLLSLYALDWGRTGRVEQVQVINAATGAVLDTETLSSFGNGAYLQWVVSGHVQIKVTDISGANAVVSGVFLD